MSRNLDLAWTYLHDSAQLCPLFGEVKYVLNPRTHRKRVEAIVLPTEVAGVVESAGLALDGSNSMLREYGRHLPPYLQSRNNRVAPTAQDLGGHLARNSQRGTCALVYWACGDRHCEPVNLFTEQELAGHAINGPSKFGRETLLAPVIRYFWESVFRDARGPCLAVVMTDGMWKDQPDVLALTQAMCEEIAEQVRPLMKVVLLGVETEHNQRELPDIAALFNQLDNYDSGTDVDVWDHKWLAHLRSPNQFYLEFFKDAPLAGGRILEGGRVVLEQDQFPFGLQFEVSPDATAFTLELDGSPEAFTQPLP